MYNIRLTDYIPEPQPAKSPYIIAAHYYAAWKKGAAELFDGFNALHDYPERTPLMGYYGEENPEVCDWQIKWASEHGINCFIHCWYRRRANMGKPVTPDMLRCGHGLHEALFNAKYQKYMNFAIMYEAQLRWGGTDADDLIRNLMPFWCETYFSRDNYLKIDNKPVLFVYDTANQIKDAFPNPADQKDAYDRAREYAASHGFDGLIIAQCSGSADPAVIAESVARGYDFRFIYNFWYPGKENYPPADEILSRYKDYMDKMFAIDPNRFTLTASHQWEPDPRCTPEWFAQGFRYDRSTRWCLSPDDYRKLLRTIREYAEKLPENAWGRKIIMVDNWDEFDEGHSVFPRHDYGFRYLQAIREELTERNNLPDYRMPQDMGFGPYDQPWGGTQDFSEICKEKFLK